LSRDAFDQVSAKGYLTVDTSNMGISIQYQGIKAVLRGLGKKTRGRTREPVEFVVWIEHVNLYASRCCTTKEFQRLKGFACPGHATDKQMRVNQLARFIEDWGFDPFEFHVAFRQSYVVAHRHFVVSSRLCFL